MQLALAISVSSGSAEAMARKLHASGVFFASILDVREHVDHYLTDNEDIFSKMDGSRMNVKYHMGIGQSNSDAEIDYRRGRSLRESRKWP
ncbi:hypothetical protein HanIR_Chr01g0015051 [Helianthus annuus]|nr:hypothetical protein HanIR_Chr01g0015051 [Helianthus annuus]